jgi:2'-hydroxyisoflavone reductase
MSMETMLRRIRAGVASRVEFTWIENAFLRANGVTEGQFPLYEPPTGDTAGFHRCNASRALARGLKFRPVADTAKATFAWYRSLPADLQGRVAPQFVPREGADSWLEKEQRLLQKWRRASK